MPLVLKKAQFEEELLMRYQLLLVLFLMLPVAGRAADSGHEANAPSAIAVQVGCTPLFGQFSGILKIDSVAIRRPAIFSFRF